jgi:nudix-type nucleoside diphosphatase (YffH/AdpP family)
MDDLENRVKLRELKTLSDNHYILRRATFEFRRSDGSWQTQVRESYDIGDGAAVLPLDRARGSVILVRQFRWPAFEAGSRTLSVEVPAGKLDGDDPETCVRREALEEAGIELGAVRRLYHCFSTPGALKERLSLFLGDYDSSRPRAAGGGHAHEGEDIAVLELELDEAWAMVTDGRIDDAKTILLIQAAKLERCEH